MASQPTHEQAGAWQGQTGDHDKDAKAFADGRDIGSHFAAPCSCAGLIRRQTTLHGACELPLYGVDGPAANDETSAYFYFVRLAKAIA